MHNSKKLILTFVIIAAALQSFSQFPVTPHSYFKAHGAETNTAEKGFAFLGVDTVVPVAGIVTYNGSDNPDDAVAGLGLSILGGACIIRSIPLFLKASKNRRHTIAMGIANQKIGTAWRPANISVMQPAVMFRYQLGNKRLEK